MNVLTCIPLIAAMNGFACTDSHTTIEPAEVVKLAYIAGFEEDEIETVLCIVRWESSFRPGVASWNNSSYGLAQIHRHWSEGFYMANGDRLPAARPDLTPQAVMDAGTAMHAMRYIYLHSGGFWPWDAYPVHCAHLN